jgi:hypothetical protein
MSYSHEQIVAITRGNMDANDPVFAPLAKPKAIASSASIALLSSP